MRQHTESTRIAESLARCERHGAAWSGVVYRSASVRYANRDDLLTGVGSKATGARWNPPGAMATVYTSLDMPTAVEEALAHHRYYGFPVEAALPRVLVSIQVSLQRVLTVARRPVSRTLGVTRRRLRSEDWRACNRAGEEALTQALGRLAWDAGWEGLLVPSAATAAGLNLIVFPGNLLPPQSYLLILNRDQLPPRLIVANLHAHLLDNAQPLRDNRKRGERPMPSRRAAHIEKQKVPPSLVAALRAKLRLPRKTFSRLTGFSERAIADWEKGKAVSEPGLRRLREIERLQERLAGVVAPEALHRWLETPNPAFAGLKPLEVIERGEVDRLWTMIFYLESGVAS